MQTCKGCGNQLKDDAKFCTRCGTRVLPESAVSGAGNRSVSSGSAPAPRREPAQLKNDSAPYREAQQKKKSPLGAVIAFLIFLLILCGAGAGLYFSGMLDGLLHRGNSSYEAVGRDRDRDRDREEEDEDAEEGAEVVEETEAAAAETTRSLIPETLPPAETTAAPQPDPQLYVQTPTQPETLPYAAQAYPDPYAQTYGQQPYGYPPQGYQTQPYAQTYAYTQPYATQPYTQAYAQPYTYTYGDYVLPYSSTTALTAADVAGLTKEQLRIARNEIYARHGRLFNDKELQAYFNSKSWYHGYIQPSNFKDESMLSRLERDNINFIMKYE